METKYEPRQGQLASTFPETFKDFFSMINEEEDHSELISNILEDKIIPRRSSSTLSTKSQYYNENTLSASTNFGRSSSFRIYRGENRDHGNLHSKNISKTLSHSNKTNLNVKNFATNYRNPSDDNKYLSNFSSNYLLDNNEFRDFQIPYKCDNFRQGNVGEENLIDKELNRPPKSPAKVRRRASAIAITEIPIEFQSRPITKQDEPYTWGKVIKEPSNSRDKFTTSKSPVPFNRKIEGSSIRETKQKQRMRTSSMPAENRKPKLADTRRSAIHCADMDMEYYRLRSFSITSHGICNLGDSVKSRRSRSINSVTSTATSVSGRDRNNSNASQDINDVLLNDDLKKGIPAYKIALLGGSGVGKTALTYQFTTSEYICAYDLSLDDDYGQKTVSVLLDGQETDLEIIDHPACEMSTEAFCSTYNIDLFVVVYSIVDRKTFETAKKILQYLKENEMMLVRGVILVGNKTDLERHREVSAQHGRKLAKEIGCKFIETSSGLDHNVDELLVGIVAQVKLNSKRKENLSEKQRLNLTSSAIQKHRKLYPRSRRTNISSKSSESGGSDRNIVENLEKIKNKKLLNKNKVKKKIEETNLSTTPKTTEISTAESSNESSDESSSSSSSTQSSPSKLYQKSTGKREKSISETISINNPTASTSSTSFKSKFLRTFESGRSPKKSESNSCTDDDKPVEKFSTKTKLFLSSFLKLKKNLRVKRRNSSSCSDLFAI